MEKIIKNENGKEIEQIISYDDDGNKVIVTQTREVIKPKAIVPEIHIDNYNRFKLCTRRAGEEEEYAYGKGDQRYRKALDELIRKDRNQYLEYVKKMQEELGLSSR